MKMKCIAAVLTLTAASAVQAATLTSMGVLDPTSATTAYSAPRAVSQDGSFVVGTSTAVPVSPAITGLNVPVVWSLSSGLVELPNPSGANSIGIGVATGVGSNAGNIIVVGLHEGYVTQRYYKAPLSSLASGSWADCASAGGWPVSDMRGGAYNALRNAVPNNDGWPPLGAWYTSGASSANANHDYHLRGDPFIAWETGGVNKCKNIMSVSAYNISVGRSTDSPSFAWYNGPGGWDYTTVPNISGSASRCDGIGISSSFGKNKTGDYEVQWICGQVNSYNGGLNMQAFRWKLGDADLTPLGTLPGDQSSCAYTIADNGVTAGRSYNPTSSDVATVWDTSGIWDPEATGTAKSLKDLLTAYGADTSAWTKLADVYACSDDGTVLAGIGVWAADGSTRGFVAYRGDFEVRGGCCVATGLGTGSCSMVTPDECTALDGRYLGDFIPCGTNNGSCGGFCPIPFADADVDGDVDQFDFAALQACYTGPLASPPSLTGPCACLDRGLGTKDDEIDSDDVAAFEQCATGPGIAWVAEQRPSCVPGDGTLP